VRVEQEDAPETRGDEALQSIREHPYVGLVVDADGSGKGAVVIRRSDPERRQEQRLITQLHLGPPGYFRADHGVGQERQVMAVLLEGTQRQHRHALR
jgi:hypothetical protein